MLYKCDKQYTARHQSVSAFKAGDKVFLKSNPEHPMVVICLLINNWAKDKSKVVCEWKSKDGRKHQETFAPQTVLQYDYAGLITLRERWEISLN